jgi:serine/threonine-protein kinase RsbW
LQRKRRRADEDQSPPLNGWSRHRLPFRLRISIPSTRNALNRSVPRVRRLAKRCGWTEERLTDLEIALVEALANAMNHGNMGRPRRRIFLRCYGGPDLGVLIAVRDQGQGFDPNSVPDPRTADRLRLRHGRGLFLMRELTDYVEFRKGGREVVLKLSRTDEAP